MTDIGLPDPTNLLILPIYRYIISRNYTNMPIGKMPMTSATLYLARIEQKSKLEGKGKGNVERKGVKR